MEDLKALTECAECTWDYIDRMRMALASACKARDEARKELAAMRNELCCRARLEIAYTYLIWKRKFPLR